MMEKKLLFVNHSSIREIRDTEHLHRVRTFVAGSRPRSSKILRPRISLAQERTRKSLEGTRAAKSQSHRKCNSEEKQAIGHPVIDSVCSIPVTLDEHKHNLIEYFTTLWMPSKNFIPPNCNIGGFTPLAAEDSVLSLQIVRGALQASSDLHIYALLAISACRMQLVNRIQPQQKGAKDLFTLKAIRALRQHLLLKLQVTDRLILDVCFLALNEFYGPSGIRLDVYWLMMQHFVITRGGFANIDLFTSHFCVAADLLIAAATFTVPTFDFYKHPELLGLEIPPAREQADIMDMVADVISNLEPRLRIACLESISMADIITRTHRLPEPAVSGTTGVVKENMVLIYKLLTIAAIPKCGRPETVGVNHQAMTADGLAYHSRMLAYRIWLWYVSLNFLSADISKQVTVASSCPVLGWVSELHKSLGRAQSMFMKTNWAIQDDVVLWISALGILVSENADDLVSYINQFRSVASIFGIDDPDHLWETLSAFPPLGRVRTDRLNRLWPLLRRADQSLPYV
jgi:hypothetical protein